MSAALKVEQATPIFSGAIPRGLQSFDDTRVAITQVRMNIWNCIDAVDSVGICPKSALQALEEYAKGCPRIPGTDPTALPILSI